MNIFKRRESTEQAAETARWEAMKRTEQVAGYAARGVRIADLTGRLKAEELAHTRTRHELAAADELIAELRKELLRKSEQIERQADVFEQYRDEIAELKQSLSGARAEARQAYLEKARAEQAAAVAERLHRERRLA